MPQIDLGKIRFDWRGTWDNSTAYELNDVVTDGTDVYVAIVATVPAGTALSNTSYWDVMVEGVTTAEIDAAVAALVDTAPATLDTLNELAAALGDDANFATTVTNSLATKQDIVSGVSDTEIGYLDGVTSGIQGQLDTKQDIVANVSDTEIGYLDGVTGGIQGQLDSKIPLAQTVADKATGYSILATDAGTLITNSAAVTITVDDVLSVGEQIDFLQMGADQITFAQGTATNLYSKDGNLKTAAQYSPASIKCVSSGVYVLVGDLGA